MKRSILAVMGVGLGLLLTAHAGDARAPRDSRDAPATQAASFRRDVAPLLVASCATRSCHGGGAHPPDLDAHADPSTLRSALTGVASEERPDHRYVKPGDPQASYLLDKLEGRLDDAQCSDHDCGVRMPARNPALPEAARAAVRRWIAEGAQDN